ncbi:MAG: NYN domain-containing protein [Puniceicoccaceae bacterium]
MKQLILVDACNVLHATAPYKERLSEGMDQLGEELLERLRPLHDIDQWELHLVIDGKGSRLEQQFIDRTRTLSLVFSPSGQQADTIIEAWLIRLGPDWRIKVVTNDRAITHTALAQGAEPLRPMDTLQWADEVRSRATRDHKNQVNKPGTEFGNRLEGLL